MTDTFIHDDPCPEDHYLNHCAEGMGALLGHTLTSVTRHTDGLRLTTREGRVAVILHEQECCESVSLIDVCGDLSDLVGSPITVAEARTSDASAKGENTYGHAYDSATWTFIELATVKGSVTLRFFGESNGYYSETADLFFAEPSRFVSRS